MQAEKELEYLESLLEDEFFAKLDVATNLNYVVYLVAKEMLVPKFMTKEEFEEIVHRENRLHILDNLKALVEEHLDWDYLHEIIEKVKALHIRAVSFEQDIEYREIEKTLAEVRKLVEEADRIVNLG